MLRQSLKKLRGTYYVQSCGISPLSFHVLLFWFVQTRTSCFLDVLWKIQKMLFWYFYNTSLSQKDLMIRFVTYLRKTKILYLTRLCIMKRKNFLYAIIIQDFHVFVFFMSLNSVTILFGLYVLMTFGHSSDQRSTLVLWRAINFYGFRDGRGSVRRPSRSGVGKPPSKGRWETTLRGPRCFAD